MPLRDTLKPEAAVSFQPSVDITAQVKAQLGLGIGVIDVSVVGTPTPETSDTRAGDDMPAATSLMVYVPSAGAFHVLNAATPSAPLTA